MDKKEELIKIIKNSDIQQDDKKEWGLLINSAPADFVDSLWEIASVFPDEIGWFNDIYKRKQGAFSLMKSDKEKATALLQDIFIEEKNKFKILEEKLSKSKIYETKS
jgi:hypothetical protein